MHNWSYMTGLDRKLSLKQPSTIEKWEGALQPLHAMSQHALLLLNQLLLLLLSQTDLQLEFQFPYRKFNCYSYYCHRQACTQSALHT
jgi:hypothetical protein